ncbi:unnamed protein product [Cuscuta campestris]|uniref:Uncharacterized protein n=1 Tax=Cuscuta campestris TaxID=132261 RepID=A0A484MHH1_9ASTE|nr:unnamed protein product [Cuscuta campestris]
MSSLSDRISSSEDCSSEDSNSSSSTGSSSLDSMPGQVPNSIPDPQPVNQMPGEVFMGRDDPVDDEPGPYDPEHETRDAWEERLHAAGYFPLPTLLNPQSNRGWKEKFVFIEFPPFVTPFAGLKWNDHLLDQEYAAPASSPDLEASLAVLMRGDPYTGRVFHYGSWVWRVESGGEGTSQAHEAAGRGIWSSKNSPCPKISQRETGGSQAGTAKTFKVQPETVEIHDLDEPEDDRSKGKGKEKTGRRIKKVATTHPSFAKKRQRGDSKPAGQSIEEAFINLGLRLKEAGEIGPLSADRLGLGSSSEFARLKKEKEEMALILKSQADELARLSGLIGSMRAEISHLKEENGRLMDEVFEAKREMAEKEETFPGRAATWVEENKAEAARVMTATPETTMESFRLLYREPEGRKMITAIGSFGFKSGQKKDRIASHRIFATCRASTVAIRRLQTRRFACQWVIIAPPDAAQPEGATSLLSALLFQYKGLHPSSLFTFCDQVSELSPVKFLLFAIQPSESSKFLLPSLSSFPAMSSFSDRISSSEDCSSEDSNSSSSTGSSSPESTPGQVPNSSIPDPHPVNQMPGETFVGRDDPVDVEPDPYDPEHETRDAWEERLHAAGYFQLPTFYVLDIPSRVSKIALNKIRRRLPDGYTLLYEPNWPNIVEPHREDRVGFHTISLDAGIVFPLLPLLTEVCHAFRILPGQITPNAHRYLHSFVNICTHLKIFPSLCLFLFCFEVLPGGSGCEGFVFFKARTGRKFISEVPQSNRGWKEKFVFIEFPPFVTPLADLKWNDHLLDQEYAAPASSPDLEVNLEVLMRGDPFTGRIFHYGSWVWRVESGGEGTSQAHEAAGREVPSPGNTAEAEGHNHPVIPQQDDVLGKRTGHLMRRAYAFVDLRDDSLSLPVG